MTVDVNKPLGDLVTQNPNRAPIFDELKLDYCCNGHRTLSEAVSTAGLNLDEVVATLDATPALASSHESVGVPAENSALAHDIVDTHHAYMWQEMPRLAELVDKVHRVHGENHPELAKLKELYTYAVSELDPHMTKEERIVFPAISKMEKGSPAGIESFAAPIQELRDEHDEVGRVLKEMRDITNDYAVPEDACGSYRMMLDGLETMERDLHSHIHKENNVLFPRVLELEQQLAEG